jgi:LPS-assembly protein
MSPFRRTVCRLALAVCVAASLAVPVLGQQAASPDATPAPAQAPPADTADQASPAAADQTPPSTTVQQALPSTTSQPQAPNTGNVPASAPAVNPASPPGTAVGAPAQGSLGPSPVGTVPSATPTASPGFGDKTNPATGAPVAPGGRRNKNGPPPGAGPNRMDFNVRFEDGGVAAGSAVTFDYKRDDYAVLTGAVKIHYQDIDLSADHVEINLKTKETVAQGNVILDQGPRRMTGTTLNFDLDTKTGQMLEATAYVTPDYYFSGVEIDKTGDDTYSVLDGVFTACDQPTPDWSFHMGRAEIDVGGYAHMHKVTFKAKNVPLLYTPWLLYPAMRDRASGFMVPSIESSGKRGPALILGYYQTLGQSEDDTFHIVPYFRGYLGLGNEFRYRPSEGTWGDIEAFAIKDPADMGKLRWKVNANHDTEDLPFGMRLVVQVQKYSDFDYLRDFERDFDVSSLRFVTSRAFITGSWGPSMLNILFNDQQILFNNGTDFISDSDQKKLPEVEYQLRSTKIGDTPFYVQMDNFLDFLDMNQPGAYQGSYGRADIFPQLTLPVNAFPWLNISMTGGERLTWYSKTLNPSTLLPISTQVVNPDDSPTSTDTPLPTTAETVINGHGMRRLLPYGEAELVGPSFSKILEKEIADFTKFKHVIEPRITYTYYGDFNPHRQELLPQFDDIDAPLTTNNVNVALDNRLLAKGDEEDASAREVLLFEVSRAFSFNPMVPLEFNDTETKSSSSGPYNFLLHFNPTQTTSLQAEVQYSGMFHDISATSLSSDVTLSDNQTVGLTWYTNYLPDTGATTSDQVRVNTSLNVIPKKLSIQAQVGWDFFNHVIGQQYYALNWAEQCYGLRLEFRKFEALTGPRLSDTDIRFSITLKNIGPILDLNSRSTQTAP